MIEPGTDTANIPGYHIETLVAKGRTASVFLALEESSRRQVALKVLDPALASTQAHMERFLTEALVTLSVRHPNVVAVYHTGLTGDTFYTAMEYLDGGDLRSTIAAGMSPSAVLELVETIACCLGVLHRTGVVHGDIKPGNILFRGDGIPVLSDFGIAVRLSGKPPANEGIVGTPDYLSPEAILEESIDGRSDIYSLGVVLYEMLTGECPYEGDAYSGGKRTAIPEQSGQ